MKLICVAFLLGLIFISCGEENTPDAQLQASPDSTAFFSIGHFFKEQVSQVILFRKKVLLFTTVNNSQDSMLIDSTQFMALADEFIKKDISNPVDKKHYRETVFQDAGTKSYTLNYTAVDRTVPVQGIDVLLDEQTNQVKRIFIRSFSQHGDTSVQEQFNWHAFKGFQINRSFTTSNGYQKQELKQVKWDRE